MTNNQIKYMIEVAQTGSVNQAARNLFISQSALSNAIMSVEQEFGRKIFNRSSHGMTLTAFGKLFIAYITPIHQQLTQLYAMRSSSAGGNTPSLSIISNGFYYISDIVAAMGQSHQASGLRISLQEDYGGNVSDVIANGMADLGVVRLWNCYRERNLESFAGAKLIYHPVAELQVGVDVSRRSPLYESAGEDISPEELAGYPQIMHESLDFGPYADILSKLHLPAGGVRYVTDSRAAMYELLADTNSYYLNSMLNPTGSKVRTEGVVSPQRTLLIKDCPIKSEFGWFKREGSDLSALAADLINMVSQYFAEDYSF